MRLLSLLFVCVVFPSLGQLAKPLQFRDEAFDYGEIMEKNGPVTHQFEFTNLLNRPVKILGVKPSCGCTTPDWSKEPIQPGKTGFVQARFDPKGRPGHFTKTLTVTTDADGNQIILQIKGSVTIDGVENPAEYDYSNGNWGVKNSSFNLGKIFLKDEYVVREFSIMNNGSKPISYLNKYDGPAHIRIQIEPKLLGPGERGMIKLSYNGKLKNVYGFQSDNVTLHTDDEMQPKKSFDVYATLEDYFPIYTPEELAKAPKMQIAEKSVDFGRMKQNQSLTKTVTVENTGKSPLLIKAIQGNCTCVVSNATTKTLKPGTSTTLNVSFNPQDRVGTQQKAVTIYTNDPHNPVQRITIAAYVGE